MELALALTLTVAAAFVLKIKRVHAHKLSHQDTTAHCYRIFAQPFCDKAVHFYNKLKYFPRNMLETLYLVLKDDLVYYPPVLSILHVCAEAGRPVVFIGNYADDEGRRRLEATGVTFCPVVRLSDRAPLWRKLAEKLRFRRQVYKYLRMSGAGSQSRVWLFHSETLCLLHHLTDRHCVIFHPLEFTHPVADWKYRLLSPSLNLARAVRKVHRVVCCEYNRAQLTRGVFALDRLPAVLPNKLYVPGTDDDIPLPTDVQQTLDDLLPRLAGKRVILYQGVFLSCERRLEEFCEAVRSMPPEYVLVAMGRGSDYYDDLRSRYASERVLFVPFIRPPHHLQVTRLASIGVLSYFPDPSSLAAVINPLYCAPNKIFEYARYGVPMISNDIPGLYYLFMQYGCGEVVPSPMSPAAIRHTIEHIYDHYDRYSACAKAYYNSVDIKRLINEVLEERPVER